jgi:transcriptional regulator with XRE-family HTH domain
MTPSELRAMRLSRGLTQTQLAKALKVELRTVQRWEHGETVIPTLDQECQHCRVAAALEMMTKGKRK